MKFKRIVSIETSSRMTMLRPSDFFARILLHDEVLSEIRPSKWGWWEPPTYPWELSEMQSFIPPDRNGMADSVIWKRSRKLKSEGMFCVSDIPDNSGIQTMHAREWIHCELDSYPQSSLIEYIKKSTYKFYCDICFIHHICDAESQFRKIESCFDGVPLSSYRDGSQMALVLSGLTLRYWLPSLPWATVFGDAYVRMFGMERLLSVPAFKVEKLNDSAVYIQLTPNLSDLETDYASFHATRLQVQAHLGNEAFFDATRAYPLRGPMGEMPTAQFMKALADFRCPPPGTNGFRVPEFRFIED